MNLVIVPKEIFNQMQAIKPLDSNEKERREMKYRVIDRIKESVKRRWDKAIKLTRVVDEIIFKATDRGYSFNGKETLAKLCDCGISTVEEALRVLKESGEAIIAYRENPNSNGYKTPIVILKNHPHFSYWSDLLGLDENVKEGVDQEVENAEIPSGSKDEQPKKVPTYFLPLKSINKNIRKGQRLDASFTKSFVPKEFKEAVRPFFNDAETIEDFWKSVYLDTRGIKDIVKPETITYTAIDAFKQAVRGYKEGRVKSSLVQYFTGTFRNLMDKAYSDIPYSEFT